MNGLLKTLIKPDWDDNPKRSLIIQAANLIQIGEFQLIQLAYKAWYEKDLPEEKIIRWCRFHLLSGWNISRIHWRLDRMRELYQ